MKLFCLPIFTGTVSLSLNGQFSSIGLFKTCRSQSIHEISGLSKEFKIVQVTDGLCAQAIEHTVGMWDCGRKRDLYLPSFTELNTM